MRDNKTIRLGRRHVPPVAIPGEIFDVYQPNIGPKATLLWLNLRWLVHAESSEDIEAVLQERTGFDFRELTEGLGALSACGLLEFGEKGEYVLNEPLSAEAFAKKTSVGESQVASASETVADAPLLKSVGAGKRAAPVRSVAPEPQEQSAPVAELNENESTTGSEKAPVSTPEQVQTQPVHSEVPVATPPLTSPLSRKNRRRTQPVAAEAAPVSAGPVKEAPKAGRDKVSDSRSADMDAVVQIYHNKIGMLGPSQYEKLRFWIDEMGMDGEVVALAIEETVKSAQNPRIQYLEGILRNWHNDDILTLQDLLKHKKLSKVLSSGDEGKPVSMDGVPNASAYQRVDPALVKKWKELYPDEYDG